MPAKDIATIHQLTAACKKYKGIVFTDKDGNVKDDANDNKDIEVSGNNTLEITVMDMIEAEITGVGISNNSEVDNKMYTTGVGNANNLDMGNGSEQINNQH